MWGQYVITVSARLVTSTIASMLYVERREPTVFRARRGRCWK